MRLITLSFFFMLCLLSGQLCTGQVSNVNQATGTLSVNIPLYTLQEGNLAVPIGLSYNGGGVAVSDIPSNVGMNWLLSTGSYIARNIRGLPDESQTKDYKNSYRGYLYEGYPSSNQNASLKDFEPDLFYLIINGKPIRFMIKTELQGTVYKHVAVLIDDTDIGIEVVSDPWISDVCSGGSWDFEKYLSNLSVYPILQPCATGLCVTSSGLGLSSFIVTTTDGIKYYFGVSTKEREYVFSAKELDKNEGLARFSENSTAGGSATSWYLSKIEYPSSSSTQPYQAITFNYARRTQPFEALGYSDLSSPTTGTCNDIPKKTIISDRFFYKCELTSIDSENTTIQINPTGISEPTNITTLIPDYQLGSMNNFNRLDVPAPLQFNRSSFQVFCSSSTNGTTIPNPFPLIEKSKAINLVLIQDKKSGKKLGYYLHHDYFSEYSISTTTNTRTDYPNGRLNLRGVYSIKFNSNNTTELLPGYSFIYDGKTLPAKSSLARDHWGYHNGADGNEALGVAYRVPSTTCPQAASADLSPNFEFAKLGSLASVKLPAGGIEYYTYELHDYFDSQVNITVGGLRVSKIKVVEPVINEIKEVNYTYRTNANTSSGYLPFCPIYTHLSAGETTTVTTLNPNLYPDLVSRFTNGTLVSYKSVKEEVMAIKNGQSSREGYALYEFYTKETINVCNAVTNQAGEISLQCADVVSGNMNCVDQFVIGETTLPYFEFIRGLPKSVNHYNEANILQQSVNYSYKCISFGQPKALRASYALPPYKIYSSGGGAIPKIVVSAGRIGGWIPGVSDYFLIVNTIINIINSITYESPDIRPTLHEYLLPIQRITLDKTITTSYEPTGTNPIELTSQYFYESQKHLQATKVQTSKGSTILSEQNIKYTADYELPIEPTNTELRGIWALQKRNMLVPIETISKRNGKINGGVFYEYDGTSGKEGLLSKIYSLELVKPLTSITSSTVSGNNLVKDINYKLQSQITAYNAKGLPASFKKTNEGGITSVTYGINDLLPTGTSYTNGSKSFGRSTEYSTPLFGASKVTGADNSSVSYIYDEIGRTKEIRDHNNHLIKSYDYGYAAVPSVSNAITFELWGAIPESTASLKITVLTDGASINAQAMMPAAFQNNANFIVVPPPGRETESIEVILTASQNNRANVDHQSPYRLAEFASNTVKLTDGIYTLEAKAYNKGNLIDMKKITFQITNACANQYFIQTQNVYNPGQTQEDKACTYIELKPGFEAKLGSVYKAIISQ